MDQVRGELEKQGALTQGLVNQPELELLQVADPPVDQLGGATRGALGKIILLEKDDGKTSQTRVASYAGSIDTAADHREVVGPRENESKRRWPGKVEQPSRNGAR